MSCHWNWPACDTGTNQLSADDTLLIGVGSPILILGTMNYLTVETKTWWKGARNKLN